MGRYHAGELSVQRRAGDEHAAERSAPAIRPEIPPVAARFLAAQPLLVVGAADAEGSVWASVLTGPPGFMRALGDERIEVHALPTPDDPLREALTTAGSHVGTIAIEPATRRRMRVNGTVEPLADGFALHVDQVVSNCPKYLQKRDLFKASQPAPGAVERFDALPDAGIAALRSTDTAFLATVGPDGAADASHRGGAPGFLDVVAPDHIVLPDYTGNAMYLTLGNLELDPRAGLVVVDWTTGDLWSLSGTAATDWDPARAAAYPGAQRVVDIHVERVVHLPRATGLSYRFREASPFNPPAKSAHGQPLHGRLSLMDSR